MARHVSMASLVSWHQDADAPGLRKRPATQTRVAGQVVIEGLADTRRRVIAFRVPRLMAVEFLRCRLER